MSQRKVAFHGKERRDGSRLVAIMMAHYHKKLPNSPSSPFDSSQIMYLKYSLIIMRPSSMGQHPVT